MVLYDRHTTNTVQVRIIHGPVRLYTVLHGLVRSYTASMRVQSSSTIMRTQTQHYKCLRLSSFIK